ncbi:MAG: hypothetical protein JWO89_3791, partial [Verrucomicrobiaceae bacterium]|nr:hypothetical protein [Verrucomicrobiaceae bacterium]
ITNAVNTLTVNSRVVDNGFGGSTRLELNSFGSAVIALAGSNSHTGGTVVNGTGLTVQLAGAAGRTIIPAAGGLTINGSTVTMVTNAGQIAAAANITFNGGGVLNLVGDNTLNGIITFNSNGATAAGQPAINTPGNLVIGGSVVSNNDLVNVVPVIGQTAGSLGRITLSTGTHNFTINGTAPVGLDIGAPLVGPGGITKLGLGGLRLTSLGNSYTGDTVITAGSLILGNSNVIPNASKLVLSPTAVLNINGFNETLGELSGVGIITNGGGASTLQVGDNNASTTFSGQFNSFSLTTLGNLNITKVGTGTLTIASNGSTSNGTLTVNQGTVTYSGIGQTTFGNYNSAGGGTFIVDNRTNYVSNRLGGILRNLTQAGGEFKIYGAVGQTNYESLNQLNNGNGPGVITLVADPSASNILTFNTIQAIAGNSGASLLIRGTNLGEGIGNGISNVLANTPNTVGGGGLPGFSTTNVRPDILIDTSATGVGLGFATYAVGTGFRLLSESEYSSIPIANSPNTANVRVSNNQTFTTNTNGTLTLNSGGGLTAFNIGSTYTVGTNAIVANAGNTGLSGGQINANGSTLWLYANGDVNISSSFTGTNGFTKSGAGNVVFSSPQYVTGTFAVNDGRVTLNGGADNTLPVVPTTTVPTLQTLQVNDGILDLNGRNQTVANLTNNNAIGGTGGRVTSTNGSGTLNVVGSTSVFGGILTGGVNFARSGNGTTTLTSTNDYTGTTTIRGGVLEVRDAGSITGSSTITALYGGTLGINDSGIDSAGNRISPGTGIVLQGGTVLLTADPGASTTQTVGTVTLQPGAATVTATVSSFGTPTLVLSNLVRNFGSTINFTGTNLGQVASGNAQINVTQIGGSTTPTSTFLAPWAIANSSDYAAYRVPNSTQAGIGAMGSTNYPAYATTFGTGNIANFSATQSLGTSNTLVGALRLSSAAQTDITFTTGSNVLNIETGGLLRSNEAAATVIGTAASPGILTVGGNASSGAKELLVYNNQNTITINSSIQDLKSVLGSGTATLAVVKSGAGALNISSAPTTSATQSVTLNTATKNVTLPSGTATFNGQLVSGLGIPGGTTITAGGGTNTVTLSNFPSTSGASVLTFGLVGASSQVGLLSTSTTISNLTSTAGMYVGQPISAIGIPVGATVSQVLGPTSILISSAATVSGNVVIAFGTVGNTYTGGTIVNQGTLNLTGAAGITVIPAAGGLTINNATVTMVTNPNQIASGTAITLNGAGVLNYVGNNTLDGSLTFNNTGGVANPTVATGTGILALTGTITSVNDNMATTPTITGFLELGNTGRTITTSGLSPVDLSIAAVVTGTSGSINKAGPGSLVLTNVSTTTPNTFSGGINMQDGSLIVAAVALANGSVAASPYGTGAITMSGNNAKIVGTNVPLYSAINITNPANTLTFGGVNASNNVTVNGPLTFASPTNRTIAVDSPAVTALLSSTLSGTFGFTKTGNGILAIGNPANSYNGATNVNGGTLAVGVTNGMSQFSQVNVGTAGTFNINGLNAIIGSLAGSGLVTNISGTAATLRTGFDNSTSTFSGRFASANQVNTSFNLEKIGTGTMNITSNAGAGSFSIGALTVSQGTVSLNGAGSTTFGTYALNTGGLLLLDNTITNVNNRLGGPNRNVNGNGGELKIIGNASAPTTEVIHTAGTPNVGVFTPNSGGSTITLVANPAQSLIFSIGRLADQVGGESLLVRGTGLGTAAAGTAGVASMLNIGNLQLIGGGTGDGSTTLGIRPDAIGDSSATGTGTGFLTYSSGIGFRPLTNAELAPGIYRTVATNANIGVSTSQVFGNLTTNSLTFSSGGGLTAISNASQLTMGSSGFLTVNAAGGFTGGLLNTGGNQLIIHQVDSVNALDFSGYIQTTNQIVKAGAGTLNILKPQYFINNNFVVNAGTVNLNSGVDNTIPVIVGADRPSTTSLIMNQGTLDLKGKNQAFNVISATNTVPGSGGTITNTGANATLTSAGGGTFGGVISGNINLVRSGNNTSTFTSASTYNGSTTIRGGVLVLQDQGQLSTNDVVANFATLTLSDQGLNVIANRIPASTNIALTGTTLNYNGAQSAASLATSGGAMLTITTGQNTITTAAMTGTVLPTTLTIGTLKRLAGSGGAVNFTGTGPNANLGQVGVGTPQTFITQINDGTTNTATIAVVTANNGILGGWATVAGTDFAGYVASGPARGGVGALGTAGFPAYSTAALSAGGATDNITVAASVTVPASTPVSGLGRTINSLRVSAASTITITTGEILTLGTGGL